MILLLDTSAPVCRLSLIEGGWRYDDEWQADRELAKGLLGYLQNQLEKNGKSWADVTGLVVLQGPGSFTGLRIGLTVLNTVADSQRIPIVGTAGASWQADGVRRLEAGEDDRIVLPEYGAAPNISTPRK